MNGMSGQISDSWLLARNELFIRFGFRLDLKLNCSATTSVLTSFLIALMLT